jgi:thiol-disulfide isomerase/thioredoxin
MRAPVDTISAPPFPVDLPWVNVAPLRMDKQIGRPVLIEFWDFCRPNSLRTLPYLKAWHDRYAADGLRVISVHTPGFDASRDEDAVRAAVVRLEMEHPVCIDSDGLVWSLYDNEGWPSRYLFNQSGRLHDFHFGEGAYDETETAIQELLGVQRDLVAPLRPEDDPEARIVVPTHDVAGAWSGPYVAGAVWAVVDGHGEIRCNGRTIPVEHPGAYELVRHPMSTEAVLELEVSGGVECIGVCFAPGLAPDGA